MTRKGVKGRKINYASFLKIARHQLKTVTHEKISLNLITVSAALVQ